MSTFALAGNAGQLDHQCRYDITWPCHIYQVPNITGTLYQQRTQFLVRVQFSVEMGDIYNWPECTGAHLNQG